MSASAGVKLVVVLVAIGMFILALSLDRTEANDEEHIETTQLAAIAALSVANDEVEADRNRLASSIKELSQAVQSKETELELLRKKSTEEKLQAAQRLTVLEDALRKAAATVAKIDGDLVSFDSTILFETGSWTLGCAEREKVSRAVGFLTLKLAMDAKRRLQITGHTDDMYQGRHVVGSPFNLTLSQKRAESVYAYLVSAGIPPERMIAPEGRGDSQPATHKEVQQDPKTIRVENASEEQRQRNRRVDLWWVTE
jgi:OmpA-OmpF porin, OOP family